MKLHLIKQITMLLTCYRDLTEMDLLSKRNNKLNRFDPDIFVDLCKVHPKYSTFKHLCFTSSYTRYPHFCHNRSSE